MPADVLARILARTEALEDLLHKSVFYDGTGRLDYASRGSGASIIPELTSDTYTMRQASSWYAVWSNGKEVIGNPPIFAILPDTRIGSC